LILLFVINFSGWFSILL